MKKILVILSLSMLCVSSAFAKCGGDDKMYDPIRKISAGCGCSGGGTDQQYTNGGRIFCAAPQTATCRTAGYDKWNKCGTGWCDGWGSFNSDSMEPIADTVNICWKYKCKVGYFDTKEDGSLDKGKCTPCNGPSDTIQGDACMHTKCPDDATCKGQIGRDCIVYNKKCMPICDVKVAATAYDKSDPTKVTIQFKSKTAADVGKNP